MTMRLFWVAVVSLVLLSTGAQAWQWPWASADEMANELFVEAVPLWNQYQAIPQDDPAQYEARLQLLNQIDENLRKIVSNYPESSLAVDIISNGQAKSLDIEKIKQDILDIICASDLYACAISESIQITNNMEESSSRDSGLGDISVAQAVSGDFEGALRTVEKITDSGMRNSAMLEISEAQAISGNTDGAYDIAYKIDNPNIRDIAIVIIVREKAKSGDIDGALLFSKEIKSGILDVALGKISEVQAASGEINGALTSVRRVKSNWVMAKARSEIYKAQVAKGDVSGARSSLEEALTLAMEVQLSSERNYELAAISAAQADSGDINGALETALKIKNDDDRDLALSSVEAKAGDISNALFVAKKIDDSDKRDQAYSNISKLQADSGDISGATLTVSMIGSDFWQNNALENIATHQTHYGDIKGALKTIELVDDFESPGVIFNVSSELSKAGDIASATRLQLSAIEKAREVSSLSAWVKLAAAAAKLK